MKKNRKENGFCVWEKDINLKVLVHSKNTELQYNWKK